MNIGRRLRIALQVCVLVTCIPPGLHAQTIDDGIMLVKREVFTGNLYSRETWDTYWEGTLKRTNDNIGRITTSTNVLSANYGITNRLNAIAQVPYVWTDATKGVLHGLSGFQDLTLAAKYTAFEKTTASRALLRAIAVVAGGIPLTDYNPELLPLSIGLGSKRLSARGTLFYQTAAGWYVNGSGAHTWRSDVELDRPYFFTDDEFVMSDRADMPRMVDVVVSGGYMRGLFMATGSWTEQRTLGGGDIRRQDLPFVSNRMNASKLGAMVMHPVPKLPGWCFEVGWTRVVNGRNVGQGTTWTGGIMYRRLGGGGVTR